MKFEVWIAKTNKETDNPIRYHFDDIEDAIKCFKDNHRLGFVCALYNMV